MLLNKQQIQALKNMSFTMSNIRQIQNNLSDEDIQALLKKAYSNEQYVFDVKDDLRVKRNIQNKNKRNREAQAKYILASLLIKKLKDKGLINDLESIINGDSNTLTEDFNNRVMSKILHAIDNIDFS